MAMNPYLQSWRRWCLVGSLLAALGCSAGQDESTPRATSLGVTPTASAAGACCPGYTLATACSGAAAPTRSRWCIQNTVPTGQSALPPAFCAYGDKVVTTLESVLRISAPDTFEFELDTQTGGAHTGTACGHFGDGVTYDAFNGNAYGATGFWGYLLSLHEAINDWTGLASGGWPTDWWADHQSAFPNLLDFHVMSSIGVANNDPNLKTAAAAQKARFYPKGDSFDAKVVALDNVFGMMPGGDGYAGFAHMFSMQAADGLKWDGLGVPNPNVKRSEYVVAYMSLAAMQPVLGTLQGPSANSGGNICNNTPDGTVGDAPYTCSEANIDAIANAHCAIAANGSPASALSSLRSGNYAAVPAGPCGASCPGECACDAAQHCVAHWLGKTTTGPTAGPLVFSGGDQNAASPAEWDSGYFKGDCGASSVPIGLSQRTDLTSAHALLCAPNSTFTGTDVTTLSDVANGDHRRASRAGDWDFGYFKSECGNNEYVSGISMNPQTKKLHGLRCASANLASGGTANCETHLVSQEDRGDTSYGDWDFGYFKGQCSPGKVIYGVSTGTTTGEPHRILCCGF